MNETLIIPTERPDVVLRQLTTPEDDQAYLDVFLAAYAGLNLALTAQDIQKARLVAARQGQLYVGIVEGEAVAGGLHIRRNCRQPNQGIISYFLDPAFRRRGLATVAVRAACTHTFAQGRYKSILGEVFHTNKKSKNVLGRAGFTAVSEGTVFKFELNAPADL